MKKAQSIIALLLLQISCTTYGAYKLPLKPAGPTDKIPQAQIWVSPDLNHFFPSAKPKQQDLVDIEKWNSRDLWRFKYGDRAESLFFFAEDIFGGQFCVDLSNEIICAFDPETAALETLANNLGDFFEMILEDYEVLTGSEIAHEWQKSFGVLPAANRLVPIIPFCVGGEFDIGNLQSLRSELGMLLRGDIYNQIKDLPDGSQIELKITP